MNELNKKIESILEHSLPIMYLSAWHNVISETGIEGLEDYLKSKYKI